MQLIGPAEQDIADEIEVLAKLLPLKNAHVLELGCGTAEKTRELAEKTPIASIVAAEVDPQAHAKNIALGSLPKIEFATFGAEAIDAPDNAFDIVLMFKSLHHVPLDLMDQALAEIKRVLKPGGRLCVLEFSRPIYEPLEKAYDFYSFKLLPRMGELIARDRASYQYLAESIRKHPDQQALRQLILDEGGFDEVEVHNLSGGIVALHRAFKY